MSQGPSGNRTRTSLALTEFNIVFRLFREHVGEKPFAYSADEIIEKHMTAIKNAYTEDALKVLMKRGCTRIGEDMYTFNRDRRLKYIYWNSVDADTSEQLAALYKNELLAIRFVFLLSLHWGIQTEYEPYSIAYLALGSQHYSAGD